MKTKFEIYFRDFIKEKFKENKGIKIIKNEIRITHKNGNARIGLRLIGKVNGYILSESACVEELNIFIKEISPPYKPNFNTDFDLVMNTSMESKYKQFSSTGYVKLPRDESDFDSTCDYIYNKITDIYLPRVNNILELSLSSIDDIVLFPDYYNYPCITALYILMKHKINDMKIFDEVINRLSKNKKYDKSLLELYFENNSKL